MIELYYACVGAAGTDEAAADIVEITGDGFFLWIIRRGHKPHQQEKRHHRGHEVGERDLPGTAVMAVPVAFFLFDDDGLHRRAHAGSLILFATNVFITSDARVRRLPCK